MALANLQLLICFIQNVIRNVIRFVIFVTDVQFFLKLLEVKKVHKPLRFSTLQNLPFYKQYKSNDKHTINVVLLQTAVYLLQIYRSTSRLVCVTLPAIAYGKYKLRVL